MLYSRLRPTRRETVRHLSSLRLSQMIMSCAEQKVTQARNNGGMFGVSELGPSSNPRTLRSGALSWHGSACFWSVVGASPRNRAPRTQARSVALKEVLHSDTSQAVSQRNYTMQHQPSHVIGRHVAERGCVGDMLKPGLLKRQTVHCSHGRLHGGRSIRVPDTDAKRQEERSTPPLYSVTTE